MRQFTVTHSAPATCDCCGKPLRALVHKRRTLVGPNRRSALKVAPGKWQVTEGDTAVEYRLGDVFKLTLGGKQLRVEIRQPRGNRRGWDLQRLYNSEAFGRVVKEFKRDTGDGDLGWYVFTFTLPESFKPWYSTWWAQLEFSEVVPYKFTPQGSPVEAHSSAKFTVKLETLE